MQWPVALTIPRCQTAPCIARTYSLLCLPVPLSNQELAHHTQHPLSVQGKQRDNKGINLLMAEMLAELLHLSRALTLSEV